jgi:hypothetical protein
VKKCEKLGATRHSAETVLAWVPPGTGCKVERAGQQHTHYLLTAAAMDSRVAWPLCRSSISDACEACHVRACHWHYDVCQPFMYVLGMSPRDEVPTVHLQLMSLSSLGQADKLQEHGCDS